MAEIASCFLHGEFDADVDSCPKCVASWENTRLPDEQSAGSAAPGSGASSGIPSSTPTAQEVRDRLREEWEALGMVSFTGDGYGGWRADLNQNDIKQIRDLLRDAAATIEAYS